MILVMIIMCYSTGCEIIENLHGFYCRAANMHVALHTYICMVQLMTKFTKTLVSSGVPRHISKITRGLFLNAQVLQRTYKYLMHVSSAHE